MKSRGLISTLTVIALLSLLATCSLDTGFRPASGTELPADQVLDVARSFSGPFAYETLLPVALNLTVQLYQQPSPAAALARQTSDSQLIVVSLRNSKGETLYSGAVPSGGTLATVLSLPAAPQDVVLRLDAPGYEPREVTIDGMVLYSEINRVMGLLSEGLSAKGDLPDTDGDGVPDIYDVDPLDPEVAFQVRTPASGQFTVAFEDLYPVPGDADYNDFAAEYFILENHMSEIPAQVVLETLEAPKSVPIEVMLHNLCGEATATAKIAGYSHKFGIAIDFPGVTASRITREYYDAYGTRRIDTRDNVANQAVVWLFENTSRDVVGKTARFEICFPKGVTRNMVSIAPYDPVLYVLNTKQEIHMVGQDPLSSPASALAAELSYMDPNGYPWALLVPEDWQHPAETQYIGKAYPLFDEWRASKGATAPYWYLYPASVGTKPGNSAPSRVSSTDSTQLAAGSNLTQYFQLSSVDPDGDSVEFLSSPAPKALQDLFSLDAVKGLASFKPGVPEGDYLFYFWSVDTWGASNLSTPFKATFVFRNKTSDNHPPSALFNDPPITGSTAIGGTLAASYTFSDPDGDLEGATRFQWYRFTTGTEVTGGEAIAGATAGSYTTVDLAGNSDSGRWLRVQVTPVDPSGAEGSPVLSGPVRVNIRILIDTFPATGSSQNDTYLALYDAVGGQARLLAQDDNGFPNQATYVGYSRIDVTQGLPAGTYYVKVRKPTELGNPNYGFRILSTDPGSIFPVVAGANEITESTPDDAVDAGGVPTAAWANPIGQVSSRSIFLELSDVDWFWFQVN